MGYVVGVYEAGFLPLGGSTSGSIDLYGRIGSLIPVALLNPQGVSLQAAIPVVTPPAPVPEPCTLVMVLAGLWVVLRVLPKKGEAQ